MRQSFGLRLSGGGLALVLGMVGVAGCEQGYEKPPGDCGYVQWEERADVEAAGLAGQCMQRAPEVHDDGTPECVVIYAAPTDCDCASPGLAEVSADHAGAVEAAKALGDPGEWGCFCEVVAVTGEELDACQSDVDGTVDVGGQPVNGFCYVNGVTLGDPEVLQACPESAQNMLRFTGGPVEPKGQSLVSFCAAKVCDDASTD